MSCALRRCGVGLAWLSMAVFAVAEEPSSPPSAQANPADRDPPRISVLPLKSVPAADVVNMLGVLGLRDTRATQEIRSNSLVVRGSPEGIALIEALVQALDREAVPPPRQLLTELVLLETGPAASLPDAGELRRLLDEDSPPANVHWRKTQLLRSASGAEGTLQIGRSVAVSAVDPRFGGFSPADSRSVPRTTRTESAGTLLTVTAQQTADGPIDVQYRFESSNYAARPAGDPAAQAPRETLTASGAVTVQPGEPVLIAASDFVGADDARARLLVVLRTRCDNP